jgi:flagellar basal-body rod protein FlgB
MFEGVGGSLQHYMSLLAARQKLVASNIANAETPGYKAKDIDFQAELTAAIGRPPVIQEARGLAVKSDGNNVSLDREARLLAENALRFNIASNIVRGQVRALRMALRDGRAE